MYVCFIFHDRHRDFKHTYAIQSLLKPEFQANSRVCIFQFSWQGEGFSNIHTCSITLGRTFLHVFKECMRVYVCLIFRTGTGFLNIHTCSRAFRGVLSKYCVCMFETSIHTCSVAWDIHTYTLSCLKHTCIHTCSARAFSMHTYLLGPVRRTYIHAWGRSGAQTYIHTRLEPSWALGSTIQKKIN